MPTEMYELGMKNRRRVLGDRYVDKNLAQAKENDFSAPLQDILTEMAWGGIWGRPGLDHKTRSLITVGMLVALNRQHELVLHLRGARNNGCTMEELQETMLHAGCYSGWPAAVAGFRIAGDMLEELKAIGSPSGDGNGTAET